MNRSLTRLWEIAMHNRGAKLLSFALAVVLWYGIQFLTGFQERVTSIPIRVHMPSGWEIIEIAPKTAEVLFRGAEEDIRLLRSAQVSIELDLRGHVADGTGLVRRVKLLPRHVTTPPGLRVVGIRPSFVTIVVDRHGRKTVPIKAEWAGRPAEGYEVDSWVCTPATAVVEGSESRLQRLENISTVSIDVEDRARSFRKSRVALQAPPGVTVISPNPPEVSVEMTLREVTSAVAWSNVYVAALCDPDQRFECRMVPPAVEVSLRARPDVLRALKPGDVRAYVDLTAIRVPGTYELPVRIHSPPGASVARVDPAAVQVTMEER